MNLKKGVRGVVFLHLLHTNMQVDAVSDTIQQSRCATAAPFSSYERNATKEHVSSETTQSPCSEASPFSNTAVPKRKGFTI